MKIFGVIVVFPIFHREKQRNMGIETVNNYCGVLVSVIWSILE